MIGVDTTVLLGPPACWNYFEKGNDEAVYSLVDQKSKPDGHPHKEKFSGDITDYDSDISNTRSENSPDLVSEFPQMIGLWRLILWSIAKEVSSMVKSKSDAIHTVHKARNRPVNK